MPLKQEVSNHWDRGLQDGDHLIMEMIIILLTHQMSSYPSPASHLPSALPWSMTSICCKYISIYEISISTKICFMLQDSGKGFRDESLWVLVAYVVCNVKCNVECNVNVRNIYFLYLLWKIIFQHPCVQSI